MSFALRSDDLGVGRTGELEVWRKRHLGPAFLRTTTPILANRLLGPDPGVLVDALEHPEGWFGARGPEAIAKRDALLTSKHDAARTH